MPSLKRSYLKRYASKKWSKVEISLVVIAAWFALSLFLGLNPFVIANVLTGESLKPPQEFKISSNEPFSLKK